MSLAQQQDHAVSTPINRFRSSIPFTKAQLVTTDLGDIALRVETIDEPVPLDYATPEPANPIRIVWTGLAFAVFLIIATLALSVIGQPSRRIICSIGTAARMDLSSLELALDAFQIDTKHYPAQTEGLQALVQEPANATGWRGPYMRIIPPDPRGKPYIYVFPGTHLQDGFDLSSAGPDGKPGTADDITNW